MRNLLYGVVLLILGQIGIWFQTNGQFAFPWFKRNPILVSIIFGTVISYMFIKATAYIAIYYDGQIWPGRFIGFAMGICSFTILTWYFMDEGINTKTLISLILASTLVIIQILWK